MCNPNIRNSCHPCMIKPDYQVRIMHDRLNLSVIRIFVIYITRNTCMINIKPVLNKWDKMVIVPNKPGEITFLLGISKMLLCTLNRIIKSG
jgi:hypothetical protein